ncbi:redox-sensitive transcriptional activator SoxR [Yinghuangia sp. ASG 101]|uniref:redox-sensitive transcriptional activator SoxR n=1 Tax=Yinghuangia sp. ASG 101 TaxID=2896848 RepID=UPI002F910BFD
MKETDLLTVSEVAKRSGFAASALRFYEREGLIEAQRTAGGRRRYERQVLRRLAFIRAARHVGLALDEIRQALATLPQSRTPTKADWARISRNWRARLDAEIAALTTLRDGLDACIGCGCLSLRLCAISNPGDAAARYGPGARFLPGPVREDGPALDGGSVGERGASRARPAAATRRGTAPVATAVMTDCFGDDDPDADPCGPAGGFADICADDSEPGGLCAEPFAGDACDVTDVCGEPVPAPVRGPDALG